MMDQLISYAKTTRKQCDRKYVDCKTNSTKYLISDNVLEELFNKKAYVI